MTEELKALYLSSRPHGGRKRLPDRVVKEICADYGRLKSYKKVVALWGVPHCAIYTILRRRGVIPPRRCKKVVTYQGRRFTPDREGYLCEMSRTSGIGRIEKTEKRLHRIVWSQERGPVPKGHKVVFKDGDRLNCDISNLECLPAAEFNRLRDTGKKRTSKKRKLALVQSVERFILLHAGRIAMACHVESSDLAQAGRLQALRAAELWKPDGGAKFLTYCANGVLNAMRREAADISNIVSCPRAKFLRGEAGQWVSLEAPLGGRDDSEGTLMDVLPAEPGQHSARSDAEQDVAAVKCALSTLDARLRRVLELRFFEGKTLVDVGEELGVTKSRIGQLEREAITVLRRHPALKELLPTAA